MRFRPVLLALALLTTVGCDPRPRDASPRDAVPARTATASESAPVLSAAPAVSSSPAPVATTPGADTAAWISKRPYRFGTPEGVDASKPVPLVLYLHGLGGGAASFERALRVAELANGKGFAYAIPDGTPDGLKRKFWNATDSCCNFEKLEVDDVGYLRAVLDDAASRRAIDPKRLYVVGFSNGGFMAHRLACELSDKVAAIVSIAGAVWEDASRCQPTEPVAVLQIHGDKDPSVRFEGGRTLGRKDAALQPGARETVARWARHDGCGAEPKSGAPFDLEDRIAGPETIPVRYTGCKGGAAELWVVQGGNHFVGQGREAGERIWRFLAAHPKR